MGYAFVTTGDKLFIVKRGFEHTESNGYVKKRLPMPNPSNRATAQLTNEADRPVVAALTETARRSQAFTCWRVGLQMCQTDCSAGRTAEWCAFNVCMPCQCCGFLPWYMSRNVQPGKSTLTKITPAFLDGLPKPAEMARGPVEVNIEMATEASIGTRMSAAR